MKKDCVEEMPPKTTKYVGSMFGVPVIVEAPVSYEREGWVVVPALPFLTDRFEVVHMATGLASMWPDFPLGSDHDAAVNLCRLLGDAAPHAFAGVTFGDRDATAKHPDCAAALEAFHCWTRDYARTVARRQGMS